MARVLAEARVERRGKSSDWCLRFKAGWERRLREEGSQSAAADDAADEESMRKERERRKRKKDAESAASVPLPALVAGPSSGAEEEDEEEEEEQEEKEELEGEKEEDDEGKKKAARWSLAEVKEVVSVRNSALEDRASSPPTEKKRRTSDLSAGSLLPVVPSPELRTGRVSGVGAGRGAREVLSLSTVVEGWDYTCDEPDVVGDVSHFDVLGPSGLLSFTKLPVCISGNFIGEDCKDDVFLEGSLLGKSRVRPLLEKIGTWTILFSHDFWPPKFCVRTVTGHWIRLLQPSDGYAKLMSDAVLLGHFLQYVRIYPRATPNHVEIFLQQRCCRDPIRRLNIYLPVIRSYALNDSEFAVAKVWREIFPRLLVTKESRRRDSEIWQHSPEEPGNKKLKYTEERIAPLRQPEVIVLVSDTESQSDGGPTPRSEEDDSREAESSGDESSEVHFGKDDELDDPPICTLCDDGGDLLFCEGPCRRHFHPTRESGQASFCRSLGLTKSFLTAVKKFYCRNCRHDQQQCFACGELGFTGTTIHGSRMVYKCNLPSCTRFYHESCLEMLRKRSIYKMENLDPRQCPRHFCRVCGIAESEPGSLVQCRRCPKGWHRRCLQDYYRSKEDGTRPIWTQNGRSYIYCRNHEIVQELQTPKRDHLLFPGTD